MKDTAEGKITEIPMGENEVIYNTIITAAICKPSGSNGIGVDFLIDTGADKSIISYNKGNDIGLEPPGRSDTIYCATDANGNDVEYIYRKINLIMDHIEKKDLKICWGIKPTFKKDILGMDFFKDYKFIINGKTKKFYITRHDYCVKCSK